MSDQISANALPVPKDQVTIVIPVKNEESAISLVIDELLIEGYSNILVVDGYSTDKTLKIIGEKKSVKVLSQHGGGKTGAVKTAIEHVTTPYMLIIDGDYTYPAKDIERLLSHCSNYAEVIGVRDPKNISRVHRFGNSIITRSFNLLFDAGLSDVCSGMYLLNTEAARESELNSKGFITEVEITAQMVTQHRVTEVPISYRPRVGKGKLSTWNGFSILLAVAKLARMYNPVLLFSTIGAAVIIPALGVLGWVIYQQAVFSVWHSGWALVGIAMLLIALQSVAVASVSTILKRMERRISERITKRTSSKSNG
jgi:dolichol-phosphate hexosyltransferase